MIKSFKISNYKNISEKLELKMKNNIFYICGKENSGKTSIIDSIIFSISHMISPVQFIQKEPINFYKKLIPNYEMENKNVSFEINIELNDKLISYKIQMYKDEQSNINVYSEKAEINNKYLFERHSDKIQFNQEIKKYELEKYIDDGVPILSNIILSNKNETIKELYEYLKETVVLDSTLNSLIINNEIMETLNNEKNLIIKILKNMNHNYKDITVIDEKIISIYENEKKVDFENESSSIQKIILYMPKIIEAIENGNIIIIDDIDKKFPKKIIKIIENLLIDRKINKKNAQLIASISDKSYIDMKTDILCV